MGPYASCTGSGLRGRRAIRNDDLAAPEETGIQRKSSRTEAYERGDNYGAQNGRQSILKQFRARDREPGKNAAHTEQRGQDARDRSQIANQE